MINKKGFTLVEIVVTAIIVGLLGVMAIPNLIKSMNRSYAQDAMQNLITIYSAEQNYFQQNNGVYLACADLACINDSSAGLGLSIVSSGGLLYSCEITNKTCSAVGADHSINMLVDLTQPISVTGGVPKLLTGNPQCQEAC